MLCNPYSSSNLLDFPGAACAASHTSKFRTFLLVPVKILCMLSHADKGEALYSSSQLLSDQDALGRSIQTEWASISEIGKLFVTVQSPSHCVPHASCHYQPWEMLYFPVRKVCLSFPPLHLQWCSNVPVSWGNLFMTKKKPLFWGLDWCSQLMSEKVSGGQAVKLWSREDEPWYTAHGVIFKQSE